MKQRPHPLQGRVQTLGQRDRRILVALATGILLFCALVLAANASLIPLLQLRALHDQLGRAGLAIALLMTAQAVRVGILRKGDVTPLFRAATMLIFGTMLLQALLGLPMYASGLRPAQDVHIIYGMATVLALPFFMFVEMTARKRPAMGSYIWGFGLLAGIALRSILTG
ncbi:MAG: hypothetical protein OXH77_04535 [Anaerolineaceae bacterium]|nr:hypothetical protein [Anaerolineaceae bacterium]